MSDKLTTRLAIPELASVGTPSSGFQFIYAKADGYVYTKNSAGTETKIKSYSMQDTYDNTPVLSGAKTINLDATIPTVHKKTKPASSFQFVHKWVDENDGYMGGCYYTATNYGISFDLGQHMTLNQYGSGQTPSYQTIMNRGTQASPTGVLAGDWTSMYQAVTRTSTGGLNFGAQMLSLASEDQTASNAGCEWIWNVVKNGTTAIYQALGITHDGNLKVFKDVLARNTYKVPFVLYTIPSPLNLTGTATETKVSVDISLPANTLGDTSRLRFDAFNSCTGTANGRYMLVRIGPNANNTDPVALYINFGGNYGMHIVETLSCLGSSTVKKGLLSWTSGAISTTPVLKNGGVTQSISVDNTVQNYITVWIRNGQAVDNSTIEAFSVEVIP